MATIMQVYGISVNISVDACVFCAAAILHHQRGPKRQRLSGLTGPAGVHPLAEAMAQTTLRSLERARCITSTLITVRCVSQAHVPQRQAHGPHDPCTLVVGIDGGWAHAALLRATWWRQTNPDDNSGPHDLGIYALGHVHVPQCICSSIPRAPAAGALHACSKGASQQLGRAGQAAWG